MRRGSPPASHAGRAPSRVLEGVPRALLARQDTSLMLPQWIAAFRARRVAFLSLVLRRVSFAVSGFAIPVNLDLRDADFTLYLLSAVGQYTPFWRSTECALCKPGEAASTPGATACSACQVFLLRFLFALPSYVLMDIPGSGTAL